jgi:hypothetical protein
MQLKCDLKAPRLNVEKYKDALHKELSQGLTRSAIAWLGATNWLVPVWTGASRSTFGPLASKVGYRVQLGAYLHPNAPLNVAMQFGNGEGTFTALRGPGIYSFSYATRLKHLIINEYNDARQWGFHLKNPGPYHFQEAGQRAFWKAVKEIRLPDLRQFIKVRKVK